jgi:hypothetical protein
MNTSHNPSVATVHPVSQRPSISTKALIVLTLLGCILAYAWYAYLGRSDLFFEADFLHIDFLRGLLANDLTERRLFTHFGEHLFPGYNLILAANYYLFGISGYFDLVVYSIILFATAALIIWQCFLRSGRPDALAVLAAALMALILLSPVNNPMWGMALAAHGGVLLLVASAIAIDSAAQRSDHRIHAAIYLFIPLTIIIFAGGYGIGYAAAIGAGTLAWWISTRATKAALGVFLVLVASLAVYVFLVSRQGPLFSNAPDSVAASALDILKFGAVMTAASVMGAAYREYGAAVEVYYACGALLWVWGVVFAIGLVARVLRGRLRPNDIFLGMLLAYAMTTIVTVSVFRIANGIEGGLGQWYNHHTKLLPVVVVCTLFDTLSRWRAGGIVRMVSAAIALLSIVALSASVYAGSSNDLTKAPYAKQWRDSLAAQAPELLATATEDSDRSNPMLTMAWNYPSVKEGLTFLYENHLWVFRGNGPQVRGLQPDGWLTADKEVSIICPAGSTSIVITPYRPDGWPAAELTVKTNDGGSRVPVKGQPIVINAAQSVAAAVLSGAGATATPTELGEEKRPLVAVIGSVACQ